MALDRVQNYPWLFHWFLAAVPERLLVRVPGLPSAITDFLHAVAVGAVAMLFSDGSWSVFALAAGLFLFSSGVLSFGIGPRSYEVTPRPVGEFFVSFLVLAIAIFPDQPLLALLFASVAGGMSLLASKFAAQVLLFGLPLLGMLTLDPVPVLVLASSLLVAVVMSGGRYLTVARGQIAHLRTYKRDILSTHLVLRYRNDWRVLFADLSALLRARGRADATLVKRIALAFMTNAVIQLVFRNAILLLLLVLAALQAAGPISSSIKGADERQLVLISWIVAMFIVFVITSSRRFGFLGESERYLEYAAPATAILLAPMLLVSETVWAVAFAAIIGIVHYAQALAFMGLNRRRIENNLEVAHVIHLLDTLDPTKTALPIPMQTVAFAFAWRCSARFCIAMDFEVWFEDFQKIYSIYPYPSEDINMWVREHKAGLAVIRRAGAKEREFEEVISKIYPMILDGQSYAVYDLSTPIT
ncbi:hypothetical protein [Algihabitans sp.]|uniref:hypothetical protein n=1 Tax=Algihabitans sp. TaxID=2821514 RepID=UPI003BABA711